MSIDRAVIVHVSYVQMKVWCIIYNVQYWGVLCVVQVVYGLGEKLFLCLVDLVLSAQCSMAPARGQPFKERYVALKPLYTF